MSSARRKSRGQAAVEYILTIGLIILFIIVALIYFRDELNAFTDRVADWIVGSSPPPAPPPSSVSFSAPPPSDPGSGPPAPTPAPNPPPPDETMTDDDWVEWLEGTWCAAGNNVVVTRAGPGMVNLYRVYPDGRRSATQTVRITSTGNDGFRETLPGDPRWWVNDQKLSDNSWRIAGRADGYSGAVFNRC